MKTIGVDQIGQFEFRVYNISKSEMVHLLKINDLKGPKISLVDNMPLGKDGVLIKFSNCDYQHVITTLKNIGYSKGGRDDYFPDLEYLVKNEDKDDLKFGVGFLTCKDLD